MTFAFETASTMPGRFSQVLKKETSAMNETVWPLLAIAVGAYLLGSLSFAVIVSRAMGLADPRSYGSGNPGATKTVQIGRASCRERV